MCLVLVVPTGVCNQSGAGEYKGHSGYAVYSTAHMWAAHTMPQV